MSLSIDKAEKSFGKQSAFTGKGTLLACFSHQTSRQMLRMELQMNGITSFL